MARWRTVYERLGYHDVFLACPEMDAHVSHSPSDEGYSTEQSFEKILMYGHTLKSC